MLLFKINITNFSIFIIKYLNKFIKRKKKQKKNETIKYKKFDIKVCIYEIKYNYKK